MNAARRGVTARASGSLVGATMALAIGFRVDGPTTSTAGVAPSCATPSIAGLDATLGIDAAHVTTVRPPRPVGSLVCSYYGNRGLAANEATITYLPVSRKLFGLIEASLASKHAVRPIPGVKSAAYSYAIGAQRYLYLLDGAVQVQLYATVPLVRLERLARALPLLS